MKDVYTESYNEKGNGEKILPIKYRYVPKLIRKECS